MASTGRSTRKGSRTKLAGIVANRDITPTRVPKAKESMASTLERRPKEKKKRRKQELWRKANQIWGC
eukprot:5436030-Prorocentrum_lima.AAC.1